MRTTWKSRAAYRQQGEEFLAMTKRAPEVCVCGHSDGDHPCDDHAAFGKCERCECPRFKLELTPNGKAALRKFEEALEKAMSE